MDDVYRLHAKAKRVEMTLREELIQVAAVAVAIIHDMQKGDTDIRVVADGVDIHARILRDISAERFRQENQWGAQHHEIAEWMAILGEEVGEAFKAALDIHIFPKR